MSRVFFAQICTHRHLISYQIILSYVIRAIFTEVYEDIILIVQYSALLYKA